MTPLASPCATRGVDDCGQVDVDDPTRRKSSVGKAAGEVRPRPNPGWTRASLESDDDGGCELRCARQGRCVSRPQLAIGDQEASPTVVEHVRASRSGQRIDDPHHRIGLQHRPEGDDGFGRILGKDDDPLAAAKPALGERVGELSRMLVKIAQRCSVSRPKPVLRYSAGPARCSVVRRAAGVWRS